tara:strand:+ start:973 stop:1335 length:363 start_codon:yes stop_codon:yes gene_type:complete
MKKILVLLMPVWLLAGCSDPLSDAEEIAAELCLGVKIQDLDKEEYEELASEELYEQRFPERRELDKYEKKMHDSILKMMNCNVEGVRFSNEETNSIVVTFKENGSKMFIEEIEGELKVET